ncbi:MAG: PAS domain-containing hybrid sensor histidine kinase/response regulator [Deltaproteobacteria bacterium]|nr:MAG: PAS domain-containing hybrid sensor histidine kinase/response regulator [Deltaproteobacteria bacterium]
MPGTPLTSQEAILTALINAAPVAILTLDLEMNVTMWNPAAERIFGWSADEVLGRPYPLVPAEEWERFEGFFRTVVSGQGFTGVESVRTRKNGDLVHIAISTAPLHDVNGVVSGAMAILEDISERKQLEARYQQAAKLEAIGRLAGGVAHDFNNLLTVILAYSDTLSIEQDPALVARGAQAIRHAAERAADLTRQLLAFSRRQVLKAEVLDLNEVVRASTDMLQRLIGADIDIHTSLAMRPMWVKADPTQIEQLLMNLSANARDAMPGGGQLHLGIHAVYRAGERWVQLSVTDTGTGMDPETAARVFEPFFTTKGKGKGTGLGMASVYGIVRQSGGEVDVETQEGVGTTFRILLPPAEPPSAVAPEPAMAESVGDRRTVLIAEDSRSVRAVLKAMLEACNHTVIAAEDGVHAIELAQAHTGPIDLVITDVVMPRMGGGELAQHFSAAYPDTHVLYVSGYADDEVVRRGVERGGHFLQKPYTLKKVKEALQRIFDS